jgi:hypothetical protein
MLDAWLRLWNGDLAQAPGIISPRFRVHAALLLLTQLQAL